jgi:hypothetical protein
VLSSVGGSLFVARPTLRYCIFKQVFQKEPLMRHPYTVGLQEAAAVPPLTRIEAETKFAKAIENTVGGPDAVAATYRAWVSVGELTASELDQATAARGVLWPPAYEAARAAGICDLPEVCGAHFEIRLPSDVVTKP